MLGAPIRNRSILDHGSYGCSSLDIVAPWTKVMPSIQRLSAALCLVLAVVCSGPTEPVTIDSRTVVEALADDKLDGRLTGTSGSRLAADFIIDQLRAIGAMPLPGAESFRLPFDFTAGMSDGGSSFSLAVDDAETERWGDGSVQALSFSDDGSVSGELVFAGYGLSIPETDGVSYDSYATLDVTDKIVLVFRYFPEDTEGELRGALARYSGLRYKALAARQRGARGLVVVTGPHSPNAGTLVPMTFDTALSGSNIVAGSVTSEVGERLVGLTGQTLDGIQTALDTGNPHVSGFAIPGADVTLETRIDREARTGYNVVGWLPAADATAVEKPNILLGAHYDHLGHGRGGNSLAREDEAGEVHNGADDNASGVAVVLSVGAHLAQAARKRHVVLAFWAGEELGLLGSADFVDTSPLPMNEMAAYLNFDMVGRLRQNRLTVQAVGTSPIWTELVEELNGSVGFDLAFIEDPYLPTDVTSLDQVDVPSLGFFTGSHEDYHRPTDDVDTLNFQGLDRIAELATAVTARLATRLDPPVFVRVEQPAQRGSQAVMRIFTGTIPDYTQEAEGLLLSGVVGGGPADDAGLQGGDIIIALSGQSITNIYDYTYALDLLRVDEPVQVVYMRDGERMEAELVPEARQ